MFALFPTFPNLFHLSFKVLLAFCNFCISNILKILLFLVPQEMFYLGERNSRGRGSLLSRLDDWDRKHEGDRHGYGRVMVH